jgi:hypothetical protein
VSRASYPSPPDGQRTPRVKVHPTTRFTRSLIKSPPTPPRKLKSAAQREDTEDVVMREIVETGSGVIPPWATLPYSVLVDVMMYASYPLYDETYRPLPSIAWLSKTSTICRAFAEPALSALYYSPPLYPSYKAHGLLRLLSKPSDTTLFNYAVKIKRLEIEVTGTLQYSCPGEGNFDLSSLVSKLPSLKHIELLHVDDRPPYHRKNSSRLWEYPTYLFQALQMANIKLLTWRWNARMGGVHYQPEKLMGVHTQAACQSLETLAFVNYSKAKANKNNSMEEVFLADAISVLPKLKSLTFESCPIVNDQLLSRLPRNLTSLTIVNCKDFASEDLHPFLITHGSQLKTLVLNHNKALNLAFLPDLRASCPQLQILKMDLRYYASSHAYNDAHPSYQYLLFPHEAPTWPCTLHTIELSNLRNWDVATAGMFFRTLIDAAMDLPELRILVLEAILKIPWRERATFRDAWFHRLEKVFLYDAKLPNRALTSITKYQAYKSALEEEKSALKKAEARRLAEDLDEEAEEDVVVGGRKRMRPIVTLGEASEEDAESPIKPPKRRLTRQTRTAQGKQGFTYDSEEEIPVRRSRRGLSKSSEPRAPRDGRELARSRTRANQLSSEVEWLARSAQSLNVKKDTTESEDEVAWLKKTAGVDRHYSDSDLDSDSGIAAKDADGDDEWKRIIKKNRQGKCKIVHIRIDDLRPVENPATENDFLDSEPSDDDDWNEAEDNIGEDEGYAF